MKLRVFAGIGMTFAFLVQHIVDILRIVWAPIVLQAAAYFVCMPAYVRGTAALGQAAGDPDAVAKAMGAALPGFGMFGLFILVTFLTTVPMVTGITRLVVTGEKPKTPFYLGWGNAETKLLLGWLIFGAIMVGLSVGIQFGGVVLGGLLGGGPLTVVIILLINVVLAAAIFIIGVRLSLLAPATVATGKISLRESWEQTDDDFWNFLGFWLVFLIAFLILYMVLSFTVFLPKGYFEAFQGMDPRDRESMLQATRKANELMVKSYDLGDASNIARMVVQAVIGPLLGSIISIAGAVAWRLVTDKEEA